MNKTNQRRQPIDEERAIALAQEGDVSAFNQLVLAYQQVAYRVAYRILGNQDAAMDATQDAFLKGFQALPRFRGGSFKAWILRITTNCSYDQLRYRQRRPSDPIDDLVEDDEHSTLMEADEEAPEAYVERQELGQAIREGLETLPEEQRLVLILSDIEGLTYAEIADTTMVSLGTVKSRLSRARAKLRDYLLEHGELNLVGLRLNSEALEGGAPH